MGGALLSDARGARLAIERDISIADFPTVTSCLANLQLLPNEVNNGFQVVAENIDAWRTNLVTRIKLYSSTIADLQTSSNATSYACNLNARTNSTISARLDQLKERYNQLDQCTSNNRDDLLSLCSLIDKFLNSSETQFLSLRDQLQVLIDSSNTIRPPSPPTFSLDFVDAEQTVVIEGLRGKVKGLEQTIVTECNAVKGLRDMIVGLSEHVNSSLSTAVASQSNTSGPVLGDCLNLVREHDVVY